VVFLAIVNNPQYCLQVIGDINSRRGSVLELSERASLKTVAALVPLANMFQYVSTLRSLSRGRASYSMVLQNYEFVPPNIEKELVAKFRPTANEDETEE
jgi:elongation factor G